MSVAFSRRVERGASYTQLRCVFERWVTRGAQNTTKHDKVRLETWALNQCLPERTPYKFSVILPGINIIYVFRSQVGNATVWDRKHDKVQFGVNKTANQQLWLETWGCFSTFRNLLASCPVYCLVWIMGTFWVQVIFTLWPLKWAIVIL
jgi:hypothetical protein